MSEYLQILHNSSSSGGFSISDEALSEINKLFQKYGNTLFSKYTNTLEFRTNPDVLQVYHSLGRERFSGPYSNILIKTVHSKYKNFIEIAEYDGVEHVEIRKNDFFIELVRKKVHSSTLSDSQKIEELKSLFNEPEKYI